MEYIAVLLALVVGFFIGRSKREVKEILTEVKPPTKKELLDQWNNMCNFTGKSQVDYED